MNIVYLDLRPFSHHIKSGFRQRAGRILNHFIKSDRIDRFQYIWWNENPFSRIRDEIPVIEDFNEIILHEARRVAIPFIRSLNILSSKSDDIRINKIVKKYETYTNEPTWILATDPRLATPGKKLATAINGKLCVDLIDNFAVRDEVQGIVKEAYIKGYADTVRLADKIIANNKKIKDFLNIPDRIFKFIASGVDWQVFNNGINLSEPNDLLDISRPRVGFVGTLSSVNDISPLNAVAEDISYCEVVLIGPTSGINKPLHSRIHVLGKKTYKEIPSYISKFDICTSIYTKNASTPYGDSQKIKEYLAAGKQVVAYHSAYSFVSTEYVKVAKDVNEFVALVQESLKHSNDSDLRDKISLSVKDQDWSYRINEILDFLEK